MALQDAHQERVRPGGQLRHFSRRRIRQGEKAQVAVFETDPGAIGGQGVEVRRESEGAVVTLHEGDGADLGVRDAGQPEEPLDPPLQILPDGTVTTLLNPPEDISLRTGFHGAAVGESGQIFVAERFSVISLKPDGSLSPVAGRPVRCQWRMGNPPIFQLPRW